MQDETSAGVEANVPIPLPRNRQSIALTILLLANLLRRSANLTYSAKLGLSAVAWTIIARLGADGPMTQTEMADKYLIDKGQLSRTAVELAEKGLILRESRDWRTIELLLAPKGRRIFAAIVKMSRARHRVLVAGLSERDLRGLYKSLEKVSTNASALLNQLKAKNGGIDSEG
jgi:DNA-binding MarR family transcriptional regulator